MEEPTALDIIIEQIGKTGIYQKRFVYIFNFLLVIITTIPHCNLLASLAAPDHWCHVPGRNQTNFTMEEWKNITIPKEVDSSGIFGYSKCNRFTASYLDPSINKSGADMVTKCDNGWDYDKTWYAVTATSQNNWVCDNVLITSNALAFGRGGEMIGPLFFAHFADNYGRRPAFFSTIVLLVIGRLLSIFTSRWEYVFYAFSMIGSLPGQVVFQGPLIISMEISKNEDRAFISMMQCFGWNFGIIIMTLFMWWLRDWVPFMIVTTLPCVIFLFSKPCMIESPRWLAQKGKYKQCYKQLKVIARVNKTQLPRNTEEILKRTFNFQVENKRYSILSLFSSCRLAKNAILLVVCWTTIHLVYTALLINMINLGGNPFLNFVTQTVVELPAYVMGRYVSDRFGRRWTSTASFICTTLAVLPILFIKGLTDNSSTIILNTLSAFVRFFICLSYYSVSLQSMETFPTCIRQTGISVAAFIASGFSVLSPYIVALGTTVNVTLPYFAYGSLSLAASGSCLFLPETFGHRLPETLEDAAKFGADQDMWGRTKAKAENDNANIPLN